MKKIWMVFILLFGIGVNSFSELSASIELGGGHSNNLYKMSSDKKASFLPSVDLRAGDFYLSGTELGYQFGVSNLFLSTYFEFLDGYSIAGKDMKSGYKSLQKRKNQTVGGARISMLNKLSSIGELQTSLFLQGGRRGSSSGLGVSLVFPITEKLSLSTGVSYTFYSKKYTDYYFGIHEKDLGGELKKTYSPKSSSSYGAQLRLEYQVTEPFSIFAFFGAERYSKEITSSPIVENKVITSTGLGLRYTF